MKCEGTSKSSEDSPSLGDPVLQTGSSIGQEVHVPSALHLTEATHPMAPPPHQGLAQQPLTLQPTCPGWFSLFRAWKLLLQRSVSPDFLCGREAPGRRLSMEIMAVRHLDSNWPPPPPPFPLSDDLQPVATGSEKEKERRQN